ncbi:MAG TPA: ABC transporter ATP-binding protein [Streptosporangiaceae bacterium]|nr:ABC transporter ATP-binding protein [Streptosporangiaceae bacterium]
MVRIRSRPQQAPEPVGAEDETAALTARFWSVYDERMASISFMAMLRELPNLVFQAVRLGYQASKIDMVGTITLNLASGFFTGYALLATTGVLQALFAAGPTPARVKAAIPSLLLVSAAAAIRAGLQVAAGWAEGRLGPHVNRIVELRLYDLTTQVGLAAFDDSDFHDAMQRANDRGLYSAPQVVTDVINCITGMTGLMSAAVVVGVLNPVLLVLLVLAEVPGGWSAVRTARIRYATNFALMDTHRRKWILTDLMSDRHTAAELRSFTLRRFLLTRASRLAAYERDAQLDAVRRQTFTQVSASAAGGVATVGVYVALGVLLAAGALPLAIAGTAILAIRSAQSSLTTLLYSVNQCYEEGLYFSDYMNFCADAESRIPKSGSAPAPAAFDVITASDVTFTYPGGAEPALRGVSVTIGRGEVVALVGENGSGKTTLAKILAGLYQPEQGIVRWDDTPIDEIDADRLKEQIAVIAQDHANWPLTARHNITMGRDLDESLLASSVASAGAGDVIDALPRGYDTLLDRRFTDGAELSGGQWQRVAVARGFYRTAPLLIMDEPTAALDARAEHALFSSVRGHAAGRTIVIITHRLASARHADRIYVLHHGRLIEQGRHADLMELGGQYAELYSLQASHYSAAGSYGTRLTTTG